MSLQGCGCGQPLLGAAPIVSLRRGDEGMRRLAERREQYRVLRGRKATRLGEAIRWAPLGPGGDPQMSLQGLRGVAPQTQQAIDASMAQLETTDAQVYNEIAEAYASGADEGQVALYQQTYDRLLDRLIDAQTKTVDLNDEQWPAFNDELVSLQADYETFLGQLFKAREARRFGGQAMGLVWGLGAAAAAAGVLWYVWRNRKKRKR
jgi:hypothetical protein